MTQYSRGNYAERRVAEHLRSQGYAVWQSRNSRTAADLIAIKQGQILLVQVKAGLIKRIRGEEWNALYNLGIIAGAIPILAIIAPRKPIELTRLLDSHYPRSGIWPGEPFVLDEAAS